MTESLQSGGWTETTRELNEQAFQRVAVEWNRLMADETDRLIVSWEQAIGQIEEEYNLLRKQGKWLSGPPDLLGVIGASGKELVHSAVIAWLLDPAGSHGFGAAFLDRVLARCFPCESFGQSYAAVPQCEVECEAGRADIVVWGGQEFTLLIENKVYSWERPKQCDDYFEAFGDSLAPHFIFLTPDGRSPATATGPARDAFRCLSYRDIRTDLASVLAETASSSAIGRVAAEQYLLTLTREFA